MTTLPSEQRSAAPFGAPLARPGSVRLRAVVAYDGSSFHGFAANPGVDTVAGTLRDALERCLRTPVTLTGAGRTDAGVHAWGQVVSFDAPSEGLDLARLHRSVNRMCAPSVVLRSLELAPPQFDARFSALWRRYRYQVLNQTWPDPFLVATAWHVAHPLDLDAMRLGCDPLIGEHDFSSFCRRPDRASAKLAQPSGEPAPASLVRRVVRAEWHEARDGLLHFEIEANAFCHQMVRSIVGTLVDVGLGRRRAGEVLGVLRARDRAVAGTVAPPHGLCLREVGYPTET